MKKFKFLRPYKQHESIAGVTSFPESQKRSGVYLIKENNTIVYVGFSGTDLYKTLYRHFQRWNDQKAERVTYIDKMKRNNYTVRVVYCTPQQAAKLEKMLLWKYEPRDNINFYENEPVNSSYFTVEDTYNDIPVERDAPF